MLSTTMVIIGCPPSCLTLLDLLADFFYLLTILVVSVSLRTYQQRKVVFLELKFHYIA